MTEFVRHKTHLERVRARIIGSQGKTRAFIEEITETNISVYGKTVGIIGRAEYVTLARKAAFKRISLARETEKASKEKRV